MHLELMRDRAKDFPPVTNPNEVTSARIWHCRYRTLTPLAYLIKLVSLRIATYPDSTFAILAPLRSLEVLEVLHLPKISDLSPLSSLSSLRRLTLQTAPGWDPAGKVTVVESLAPLARLPQLEELELFGVVPRLRTVDDLLSSKSLRRIKVSQYPAIEMKRLYEHFAQPQTV